MTPCPKCKIRFSRKEAIVSGEEATQIRRIRYARKRAIGAKLLASVASIAPPEVIRGDQVPSSVAEAKFKARAIEKGWQPHRPSWPDFLVQTDKGLIAVEVKSRGDQVSKTQRQTFDLLEAAGVQVFLWRDTKESKGTLVRWEGGLGLIKVGLW